jgi:hypothetical protein
MQLVALLSSRLHPPIQAQAPVSEPECFVPGHQPNKRKAAGVEVDAGFSLVAAMLCTYPACRHVLSPRKKAHHSEPTIAKIQPRPCPPSCIIKEYPKRASGPAAGPTIETAFPPKAPLRQETVGSPAGTGARVYHHLASRFCLDALLSLFVPNHVFLHSPTRSRASPTPTPRHSLKWRMKKSIRPLTAILHADVYFLGGSLILMDLQAYIVPGPYRFCHPRPAA